MSDSKNLMIFGLPIKPVVLFALATYWLALAIGTHIPVENVPNVPTSDKALHFGAYFGLAVLVNTALLVCGRNHGWLTVITCLAFYGAIDEWLQIPVGRSCEFADWLADLAGVIAGTAAFRTVRYLWHCRSARTDNHDGIATSNSKDHSA